MAGFREAVWRKSSRSGAEGNCVEVSGGPAALVGVRDSKDVGGPVLVFSPQSWRTFLSAVRRAD
ncbi:DUF397 domain-containing protein [Micromonospora matsumotoense]|uniref:DUF397 domain-containing protein n=1 Tax=Micromonospora matsumotoense TaxID=121616 RepID=UPI0033CCFD2F